MGWPLQSDGALTLTTDTTNAAWVSGFLRRPSDGALVATQSTSNATKQRGFLRKPTGELVYNAVGTPAYSQHGFTFASDDSLCTQSVDPDIQYSGAVGGADDLRHHGLKFDSLGRVYATVVA
jgi:hypothetical protein